MTTSKKLGWIFLTDSYEGIPYLQCPHCSCKVSGKHFIFASKDYRECPRCGKELSFDNITEENLLYINSYFGDSD